MKSERETVFAAQQCIRESLRARKLTSANPYACLRRCVCVSVCYVILSRPQLLSHTQQAHQGAQPSGSLLPVSVFFHPSFFLSLSRFLCLSPSFFLLSSCRSSTLWSFLSLQCRCACVGRCLVALTLPGCQVAGQAESVLFILQSSTEHTITHIPYCLIYCISAPF